MSRFSPTSSRTVSASLDEAAEMRELDEFFRQQDPVNVAAVNWHSRSEQGLTADEQEEFRHWLAASPSHAAAYQGLDHGVGALRAISAEEVARVRAGRSATSTDGMVRPDPILKTGARPELAKGWASIWSSFIAPRPRRAWLAFCCVAVLTAGIVWHQWDQRTFSHSYVIERGQRQTVTLPDGTELAFDAETQAQVALYHDRREVRITEGQIMFSVAADSTKPFQVLAGPARVTVVGTRFSVRYRLDGMDTNTVNVAVEKGHVRVADAHSRQPDGSTAEVDLVAGQGLTVSADGAIGKVSKVAPGSIAPWRKGLVHFENTSLSDALLELERYGATGLTISDPVVAAMPIGGSFQIGRPEAFAQMVVQIHPLKLVKGAGGKIEIARAP
ncbi:iron dicitrate transport regulator FecR [Achromobacter sp. Root565]|nr:FecR domain-containing protein [Achromobacter sp. Root565]KRA03582.1 iron dicitrate transport regulator FecR [Achromobacter sp. Root565]